MDNKKKLLIIGGGVSGLSAGIYAFDNGFETTIIEKHSVAGGQCTGWTRKRTFIDGCAHWIVGTNEKSDLYPLWRHTGAINDETVLYPTEYFSVFDVNGERVTFYADLKKLESELTRVAPEDKAAIKRFIRGVKAYEHVKIPVRKPVAYMSVAELLSFGLKMFPMVFHLLKYKALSSEKYACSFRSPILKEVFGRIINKEFNVHSLFYIMQALSENDAAMVGGGSKKLAERMSGEFVRRGGRLMLNAEARKIIVKNGKACGAELKNGEELISDFVISSADAHHTLSVLLNDKYDCGFLKSKFLKRKENPLITCCFASFKVTADMNGEPKMINFGISPIRVGSTVFNDISVRNYSFDKTLNDGATTFTVLMNLENDGYDYFNALDKEEYEKEKARIGKEVREEIKKYFNLSDDEITLIDFATPKTYERYTNAYRGAYMSFMTTDKSRGLMCDGIVKGVKNFAMAGQWLMPPGGLPIALFTGKHAVQRICRQAKIKFINADGT